MWITSMGNHEAAGVSQNAGILIVLVVVFSLSQPSQFINSLRPSDAILHCETWSVLVLVMAWSLFGAKLLTEPVMTYCWLDFYVQTSGIFYTNYKTFEENAFIMPSTKCWPFCSGLNVLTFSYTCWTATISCSLNGLIVSVHFLRKYCSVILDTGSCLHHGLPQTSAPVLLNPCFLISHWCSFCTGTF